MAHEREPRSPAEDATLAALPWLVNGTLAGEEAARARVAIGSSLEARRQHRELEALAVVVRDAPLLDANAELGFENLRAALDAGAPALERNWALPTRARPVPMPPPVRNRHRWIALAAGVLLSLYAIRSAYEPSFDPAYRALTRSAAADASLRVVFDASLDDAAIDARLAAYGARRLGPVDANRGVRVVPGDTGAERLAAALARDPAVRLVGAVPR